MYIYKYYNKEFNLRQESYANLIKLYSLCSLQLLLTQPILSSDIAQNSAKRTVVTRIRISLQCVCMFYFLLVK